MTDTDIRKYKFAAVLIKFGLNGEPESLEEYPAVFYETEEEANSDVASTLDECDAGAMMAVMKVTKVVTALPRPTEAVEIE